MQLTDVNSHIHIKIILAWVHFNNTINSHQHETITYFHYDVNVHFVLWPECSELC
jgi:hypothetical protein